MGFEDDPFPRAAETDPDELTSNWDPEDLLRDLFVDRPPIPIVAAAERCGLDVLWGEPEEAVKTNLESDTIFVREGYNISEGLDRKKMREAVAHGIAHKVKTSDGEYDCPWYTDTEDHDEMVYWRYAAGLLVPDWMVGVIGQEIASYAPSKLAPHFDVTPQFALIKLRHMGILD